MEKEKEKGKMPKERVPKVEAKTSTRVALGMMQSQKERGKENTSLIAAKEKANMTKEKEKENVKKDTATSVENKATLREGLL